MMKSIHIIASYYANDDMHANVGGIESYIQLLSLALAGVFELRVYQPSKIKFESEISGVHVLGMGQKKLPDLVKEVEREYLKVGDVLLFSTDQYCCSTEWANSVVIQHGISWDLPINYLTLSMLALKFERLYRVLLSIRNNYRVRTFSNVVCVDYNYPNWYRTMAIESERSKQFFVIPNSAGPHFIFAPKTSEDGVINICFARRFIAIRGIYLFLEVARILLARYENVRVIFSGDGPENIIKEIEQLCESDARVKIIKCGYTEMAEVYRCADIVVIPSLASEGTSLTAIEAMAMGKCVVASEVGGLTNIIIDGYNGFLVTPSVDYFLEKLCFLVENPERISQTGDVARHVYDSCFSFDMWAKRWRDILGKILGE